MLRHLKIINHTPLVWIFFINFQSIDHVKFSLLREQYTKESPITFSAECITYLTL